MSYQFFAADLMEVPDCNAPRMLNHAPGITFQKKVAGAGLFQVSCFELPHIQVSDLHWHSEDDIVLHYTTHGDTVDINFQLQGYLQSEFAAIGSLPMNTNCHNMIHAWAENEHRVARGAKRKMFHLSLHKDFFREVIGCEDRWSETILQKLENGQAFRAVEGAPPPHVAYYKLSNLFKTMTGRAAFVFCSYSQKFMNCWLSNGTI